MRRASAGATMVRKETSTLTGLPGSMMRGTSRPSSARTVPWPCGLPGCMATRAKCSLIAAPAAPS